MKTALVIGGTGMLRAAACALSARGWELGLAARRATRFEAGPHEVLRADADWSDPERFSAAVRDLTARLRPVDLALVWTHDRPRGLALDIARLLAGAGGVRRFYHVMGSAVSDPANRGALEKARAAFEKALPGAWRPVRLGFVVEAAGSRWLTHEEISAGVLKAIDEDLPDHTIGITRPWELKPRTQTVSAS